MKHLKGYSSVPRGGLFQINDTAKGFVGQGYIWEVLRDSVIAYRKANGLPIGLEFDVELEQALCAVYPDECRDDETFRPLKRRLAMMDIVRGSKVMLYHRLSGSPLVSQQEADRRAKLCADCPASMRFHKPCSGLCAELVELISATGNESTPHDDPQRACGICGCYSKISVWFPLETQCPGTTEKMRQEFERIQKIYPCWKRCVKR